MLVHLKNSPAVLVTVKEKWHLFGQP